MAENMFDITLEELEQTEAFKKVSRIYFNGDLKYNETLQFLDYNFELDEDFQRILDAFDNRYGIEDIKSLEKDIRLTAISHDKKLVFIYDNPNKFNKYRALSLENYPEDLKLGYPKELWIEKSLRLDNHTALSLPLALQDSMVDISLSKSGYMVIRIMSDSFDWKKEGAVDRLSKLVENSKKEIFDL